MYVYMQIVGAINYAGQHLKGEFFTNMDLSGATFKGADLTDTYFIHSNLSGVDFEDANMQNAVVTESLGKVILVARICPMWYLRSVIFQIQISQMRRWQT
jgi:uncharacterized protein YjbI with pentapeptide repeats